MEHDASDILGHQTMPTLNKNQRASFFPFSMTGALFTSFLLWGIYLVGNRLWRRILQWRERSYRLATRRRHGIPDSDLRPFNVAYADAMNRAREEENKRQGRQKPAALRPHASLPNEHEMQPDRNLRRRQGVPQRPDPGLRSTIVPVPGRYTQSFEEHRTPVVETRSLPSDDIYVRQNGVQPQTHGSSRGLTREAALGNIFQPYEWYDVEDRKRAWDEESDEEHEAKKTRVEDDDLIDGDEDVEFQDASPPKRGAKRSIQDEADSEEPSPSKKSRGKRARKVSRNGTLANGGMDVDDEEADQITELKSSTRGKKRDRAEAGSTFGGDDEDSAAELELEGDAQPRRHRKRRTVAKRKSEATYVRGKQRGKDEDDVSDVSSGRSSPSRKTSRKKKSKRPSHVDRRETKSDVSMDESTASTRSKVRSIGNEWESNGVQYKIGPNGQRLRQALVKKARQKFVMPKDSQHPDRDVNLQVYVETWLTEEEYTEAKAQHLLAWQEPLPAKLPEQPKKLSLNTSQNVATPPSGKNLLWTQSTASTPTMSPASQSPAETPTEMGRQRGFRHSLAGTPAGFPISPFTQSQIPTVKRIASNTRASLGSSTLGSPSSLTDSTNGKVPHKVFSKWEKQELEAQAMMKIREATRRKEMEKEAKLKEEREIAERQRAEREQREKAAAAAAAAEAERKAKEAAEKAKAATAAAPTITVTASTTAPSSGTSVPSFFTQPASSSAKTDSSNPFGFAKPATSGGAALAQPTSGPTFSFVPPSTSSSGGTSAPKPAGSFNFPAPSAPASASVPVPSGEQEKEGSSLLSRLGPQSAPNASKTQSSGQPTGTNAPLFSFPKPGEMPSSSSVNPFGGPSSSNTNTVPAPSTSTTTTPKFNFNLPPKPSTPAQTGSSSLSGALGGGAGATGDAQKTGATGTPMFSFKPPSTPASASTSGGAGVASTPPSTTPATKYTFVTSTAQSPFGHHQQQQQHQHQQQQAQQQPQQQPQQQGPKEGEKKSSIFGTPPSAPAPGTNVFGSTTPANSPFGHGGGGSSAPTSVFGTTNTPSAFGGGGATGAAGAGASSTTPSSSVFGKTSGPSGSVFGNTSGPSAFGTTSTPGSSGSVFGNTSTPGPSGSVFGNTTSMSTPSVFGGAAGGKATSVFGGGSGSTVSPFGATAAQTSSVFGGGGDNKPAATDKPTFGFTNAEPSSNTTPGTLGSGMNTSTPKFAFGATSTPGTNTTGSGGGSMSTTPLSSPANNVSGDAGAGSGAGAAAPAFSFKFGQPGGTPSGAPSTTPQSSPFGAVGGQGSVFGGVAGTGTVPSAFGGGSMFENAAGANANANKQP